MFLFENAETKREKSIYISLREMNDTFRETLLSGRSREFDLARLSYYGTGTFVIRERRGIVLRTRNVWNAERN